MRRQRGPVRSARNPAGVALSRSIRCYESKRSVLTDHSPKKVPAGHPNDCDRTTTVEHGVVRVGQRLHLAAVGSRDPWSRALWAVQPVHRGSSHATTRLGELAVPRYLAGSTCSHDSRRYAVVSTETSRPAVRNMWPIGGCGEGLRSSAAPRAAPAPAIPQRCFRRWGEFLPAGKAMQVTLASASGDDQVFWRHQAISEARNSPWDPKKLGNLSSSGFVANPCPVVSASGGQWVPTSRSVDRNPC